jgi:enoyl-CoA hydratase
VLDVTMAPGAQTWTMRFGRVNAIDPEFVSAMESALDTVFADESVAVVVITSGLGVFSAGADASWMGRVTREHGAEQLLADAEWGRWSAVYRSPYGTWTRARVHS